MKIKYDILKFAQKYPNQWHSFAQDKFTLRQIRAIENTSGFTVNWINKQFYFDAHLFPINNKF